MNKNSTALLDYMENSVRIKEEYDSDADDEIQIGKIHHDGDDVDEHFLTPEHIQNTNLKISSKSTKQKSKTLKKIAFKDKKKNLARMLKMFPILWDKNDKFYRNRKKREKAWCRIANELNTEVSEVKRLWKKLKDTHRYLSTKARKNTDFNPADFFDEDNEWDIMEEISFLDDSYNTRTSDMHSLNENEMSHPSMFLPDILNVENSNLGENADSSYSCTDVQQPTLAEMAIEAPTNVTLKHMHIWMQLEKLFENLDEDKITDLNVLFVSETYKAILDKRKNK